MVHNLSVRDLGVRYGRATAVAGVDHDFEGGTIHAVVGPNGAGKSSLMLAIYGAIAASGTIEVDGEQIESLSATERARKGIALVPQGRQVFPTLTVRENLEVMAEVLNLGSEAIDGALHRFDVLWERQKQLAGNLSGGEQQMLAVTRALMGDARIVLMDEMTTGLAPLIVDQLMATARDLSDDGAVVIMAEPSIGAIRSRIDCGIVLLRGEVVGAADRGEELDTIYQERMGVLM